MTKELRNQLLGNVLNSRENAYIYSCSTCDRRGFDLACCEFSREIQMSYDMK